MSISDSVDWDAFQTLLANAFAVQESGLDIPCLSALIEIQRLLASDTCELEQAMHLIAERALGISNASGVTIGMLDANKHELVYRAGSGSAASDVGRRVPAVLSVSSAHETRREILRVENANADPRVEAEICRQFGATSLLMLPIYKKHALAGVLQVLFSDAHSFPEREVRAYRLIVAALEEGMLRSEQAQKQQLEQSVKQMREAPVASTRRPQSAEIAQAAATTDTGAVNANLLAGSCKDNSVRPAEPEAKKSLSYEAIPARGLGVLWSADAGAIRTMGTRAWSVNMARAWAAIAAVVLLSVSLWIFRHRYFSDTRVGTSSSASHDAKFQAADPALLTKEGPKALSNEPSESASLSPGFKRVRVGPTEVDYIADDVTIRTFVSRASKPQIRSAAQEVDFGDDVTVRYFVKSPASQRTSVPAEKPSTD
jgi:hypothetical protein